MTSARKTSWRLVDSGLVSPEASAAADEAIVDARIAGAVPDTLHFYVRDSPAVSIGYNKSVEESVVVDELVKRGIKIVRRFSGGSAIYTDSGQLIFALVAGSSILPTDVVKSYCVICSAVVRGLSFLGVNAEHKPINDILIDGKKVSGSAQLRRKGVVLHHGTLILDSDWEAMRSILRPTGKVGQSASRPMTSLKLVLGSAPDIQSVKIALSRGFSEIFETEILPGKMTSAENEEIENLVEKKYGSRDWNWKI